tara:strand:- start:135 stop:554 length:420 start_codon:yes stop_codon:yes gene_type:complete
MSEANKRNPKTNEIPLKFVAKNLFNPKIELFNISYNEFDVDGSYFGEGSQLLDIVIDGLAFDPEKCSTWIVGDVRRARKGLEWKDEQFVEEVEGQSSAIIGTSILSNDSISIRAEWDMSIWRPYPTEIKVQFGILETNE